MTLQRHQTGPALGLPGCGPTQQSVRSISHRLKTLALQEDGNGFVEVVPMDVGRSSSTVARSRNFIEDALFDLCVSSQQMKRLLQTMLS